MRSLTLILTLLDVSTGCKTTGGKIFGTLSLASAIGGSYLTVTSSPTIENGRGALVVSVSQCYENQEP